MARKNGVIPSGACAVIPSERTCRVIPSERSVPCHPERAQRAVSSRASAASRGICTSSIAAVASRGRGT